MCSNTGLSWWWWWWSVGVMAGQQRVKLAGKEARELFLRSMSLVICMRRNLILFWTGNDKSIFRSIFHDFLLFCTYSLIFLCRSKIRAFIIRAILLWTFLNSQFQSNFLTISRVQFLGSFSGAISWKFLWLGSWSKEPPVDSSCTNIEPPHATATRGSDGFHTKCWLDFWKRKLFQSDNQQDRKFFSENIS